MKTVHRKGVGYERPADRDEIKIDLKVYQGEVVHEEMQDAEFLYSSDKIPSIVSRILTTMK